MAEAAGTEAPVTASEETEIESPGNILADVSTEAEGEQSSSSESGQTEGEKKEGEEPAKPEPRAPEEYADFTIPEGQKFAPETLTEFKAFAKEQDLTQDQAQKLLEFGGEKIKAQLEAPYRLWNETQAKWQKEVKADPEIGGANFEGSVKAAAEVFKLGPGNPLVTTPEDAQALRDALNATGAGNNPAMVKFFVRLGSLIKEPGSFTGKAPGQKDVLNQLYPSMATAG